MNEELSVNFSRPWVTEILASLGCDAWSIKEARKCTLDEITKERNFSRKCSVSGLDFS